MNVPTPPETPCVRPPKEASSNGNGYYRMSDGAYAHRLAYEERYGEIPEGLQIDHLCRVRWCCNPDHLEAVTPRVNSLRSEAPPAKNARRTECLYGHPLDGTFGKGKYRTRYCKTCLRDRQIATGQISSKGRKVDRVHCPQGHPYDEANTYVAKYRDGSFRSRMCRACMRDRARAQRARRKEQRQGNEGGAGETCAS